MTETRRPDPCHYDRTLGHRVTRDHRDDCPRGNDCPATNGCAPCTAPHCAICGREHATNDQPLTCAKCLGKVRDDLVDIRTSYALLAREALAAGADGRLVAAAPIPGGTAQVLIGPSVQLPLLRTSRTWRDDHPVSKTGRPTDPLPPLAVLAQWEDIYRTWLGHDHHAHPTQTARWGQLVAGHRRATIGGAISYLLDQLPYIAQAVDGGPDFLAFTRQIRSLRAACERALHNEREPEEGVECFECGDKLVRRFRPPTPCRHMTPARAWWLVLRTYPELQPTVAEAQAARRSCGRCTQGGIDDPTAGLSWECPGCRKSYDPGEYVTAVRRDLLDRQFGGEGWTHVTMAASAAGELVGMVVPATTVRKWMDRGKVSSCCQWTYDKLPDGTIVPHLWGTRLVFWPDVADEALAAVTRHKAAAERRRQRAAREQEQAS